MRAPLHEDLDTLNDQLVSMSTLVTGAMQSASAALLGRDTTVARTVIDDDSRINTLQYAVDDQVIDLMTRYQPIAGDLRLLLAAVRIATDLERMGDMAVHVAKIAERDGPAGAIPATRSIFESMSTIAVQMAETTTGILISRDVLTAAQFDLDDDEMDAQFDRLMRVLGEGWTRGAETAVDVAMLGRSYERYTDHAVRIAHQIVYLVTGEVQLGRPS
ncbi:MAG TPA: phosphate signaling complex protein PhoU [Candidatus Stackebrandtia excrementipullorum]|nr:phosphate signaling complex protein PhoU [Candidatus Stackebrandtia excrementipullorum]